MIQMRAPPSPLWNELPLSSYATRRTAFKSGPRITALRSGKNKMRHGLFRMEGAIKRQIRRRTASESPGMLADRIAGYATRLGTGPGENASGILSAKK
jgi:hypothetical protein